MHQRENCLMAAIKGTVPNDLTGLLDELKRYGLSSGSAAQDEADVKAFLHLHRAHIVQRQTPRGTAGYLWN